MTIIEDAKAVIESYELGITTRQVYYGYLLEKNIKALTESVVAAEGMVLVPSESSSDMEIAAMERHGISKELAADIWMTMLAVAAAKAES